MTDTKPNNPFEEGGGTAFPLVYDDETKGTREIHAGMTMRDWFAGKAMQAYLTAPDTGWKFDALAGAAYAMADAMLKARAAIKMAEEGK